MVGLARIIGAAIAASEKLEKKPKEKSVAMKKLVLLVTAVLFAARLSGQPKEAKEVTTPSGLKYVDHKVGAGDPAVKGSTVEVHYTGWLYADGARGKKFDSSVDRNQPFRFVLGAGRVIKGWDEGVEGMKVGGKRELIIPASLGYGASGAGGGAIPPNATLDFEVELLQVVK